jgi:hypothetical protein
MGTKTETLQYRKDNGDGTTSYVSGAAATVEITRLSDGYKWDSLTSAFVASGQTNPTMTEIATGVFFKSFTVTAWQDGEYAVYAQATKSGESPYGEVQTWTLYGGVAAGAAPGAPSAAGVCRCYLYFSDVPAVSPTVTAVYVAGQNTPTNNPARSITGVYNASTGAWYVDLVQASIARVDCIARGVHRVFRVPVLTAAGILAQGDVG